MYSNREKLAAVITHWARPAIGQITCGRLDRLEVVKGFQERIQGCGLVGQNYRLSQELMPFAEKAIDVLLYPCILEMLGSVPEGAVPALAIGMVEAAMEQPKFSVLDGLVVFDREDLEELRGLLQRNLPAAEEERYCVIDNE